MYTLQVGIGDKHLQRKQHRFQTPGWGAQRSIPTHTYTFPITWLPESRWQPPTFPWVTACGEGECLLCPALLQSLSSPLL